MWEIIGEEKHLNARIACRGTRLRVEVLDLLRLIKQDIVTREKTYKEKSASTRVLRVEVLDLLCLMKQDIVTREKIYKEKSASTRVLRVEALDWSE